MQVETLAFTARGEPQELNAQLRLFKCVRIRGGRGRLMNVRDRPGPPKWRANVRVAGRETNAEGNYIRRKGEWRRIYLVSRGIRK